MYNSIVLAGPTGVGKTEISILLAKRLNMEIISADATQVYKELDIGSAKIRENEKQNISHYLIDVVYPFEDYSLSRYYDDCNKILNENKQKEFLITGGTGLYIYSITDGFSDTDKPDEKYRAYLLSLETNDLIKLLEEKGIDKNIDLNNRHRIIRQIEKGNIKYNNIKGNDRNFLKIFLTRERENLYKRINKRVDLMFENGLLEEAKKVYNKYGNNIKAIGYKELFMYFENKIDLETVKNLIKRNSRRYAKRQFTWFKNKGYITYDLDKISKEDVIERIVEKYGN